MICNICDVNQSVGVYASRLGPFSEAMCQQCLDRGAESIQMLNAYCKVSNIDPNSERGQGVASMITFFNGRYDTYGNVFNNDL